MTQKSDQFELKRNEIDYTQDVIDLFEILKILWKWKYLIILGTAVIVTLTVAVNLNMKKIYQITMLLKPGIQKLNAEGKPVYIESVQNIKLIIENEIIPEISEHLKEKSKDRIVTPCKFKVDANEKSYIVTVICESPAIEEGTNNLNYLSDILFSAYDKRMNYLHENYDYQIMLAKRQLEFSLDEEKFVTSKINDIQHRLDKFTLEIETSTELSNSKIRSQDTLLDYSSIVEKVADLKRKQSEVSLLIDKYKKEIKTLANEKNGLKAFSVIQPPTANPHPVSPQKKRNIILAIMLGLFLMVSLTFFIEYILRHKRAKLS